MCRDASDSFCRHTRHRYFIAPSAPPDTPATLFAAIPVDDTLSPLLSLRVACRRPHRVPRRVLLVSVGGAKNGRLVEPLCHNLQTNGQGVPGEAAGDGYRGNTG